MKGFLRDAPGSGGFLRDVKSWFHPLTAFEATPGKRSVSLDARQRFNVNGGLTVLVVDDNLSHLMRASELLEQCGISVLLASDGAEAVLLACERSFDIILMDLQMPVLDGLQATSKIRQFEGAHSRRRTPVVAYSTSNVSKSILADCGFDGRLAKPFNTTELEACLLQWCEGFRPWSGSVDAPAQSR
jgi:CheY-like chemotaxis protein